MKSRLPYLMLLISCTHVDYKDHAAIRQQPDVISELAYQPQMVGPYVISSPHFEGHASITPSGNEIYFAIYTHDHSYSTIAHSTYANGSWKEPEIAGFSGKYADGSPALSPDGKKLFFSSRRPVGSSGEVNSSNDIWYVEQVDNNWSTPVWLPAEINTGFNEFSPSVDLEGNLYFCSNRPGGFGDMDVYYAEFSNGQFQASVLLDSLINSKYHEGNVGVSPDGKMLFVMVQHKPGDLGYDDIHFALRTDQNWSPLKNIGSIVNTYSFDFSPKVSPDGKTLFFASRVNRDYHLKDTTYTHDLLGNYLNSPLNGLGNIYKIELEKLDLNNEQSIGNN